MEPDRYSSGQVPAATAVNKKNDMMGSLLRKQFFSYETSGRNPTDLDLLDEGSKKEIQSLTLEE